MMALNDMELEETELSLSREAMSQQIDQLLQRTSSAVSELEAMKRCVSVQRRDGGRDRNVRESD